MTDKRFEKWLKEEEGLDTSSIECDCPDSSKGYWDEPFYFCEKCKNSEPEVDRAQIAHDAWEACKKAYGIIDSPPLSN